MLIGRFSRYLVVPGLALIPRNAARVQRRGRHTHVAMRTRVPLACFAASDAVFVAATASESVFAAPSTVSFRRADSCST